MGKDQKRVEELTASFVDTLHQKGLVDEEHKEALHERLQKNTTKHMKKKEKELKNATFKKTK